MSDFSTVLTEDARLQLTDKIDFAIYKGPATIAPTTFPATGAPSSTSHQYMITVPSLENCVDRCIMWESEFTINFASVGNVPAGQYILDLGGGDALAAFPLHNLITQMNCQINSTQVNINMQDILPQLLTMVSRDELVKWNNMTPTYLDNYANYDVGVNKVNNPLGNYGNAIHPEYMPRGSFFYTNVVNPVGADAPLVASVTVKVREPLLISPLLFACEGVALQGINQFNFQINLDSEGKRVWRSATITNSGGAKAPYTITGINFSSSNSSTMYVNFLTPSPYQLAKFSARNVCDYYQLDRYVTPIGPLGVGVSTSNTTQSIQLASIPDKAIICIKESYANLTNYKPDYFCTIDKVAVNFNAKQNILAQASQQLLYRYSVEAGSQQTWLEFSGKACTGAVTVGGTSVQQIVGTPGSVLCLDFGKHIDIPEMYLSSGSAGQYNLQFNVNYTNNTTVPFVNAQIVLIIMTSGIFSSEKGQSQVFTSLLNKDAVMGVLNEKAQTTASLKRLVGGSWLSSLMRVGKALAPLAKEGLSKMGGPVGTMGAQALGALGYGKYGAGPSGGLARHYA